MAEGDERGLTSVDNLLTWAVELLVSRGHELQRVLHEYTIQQVVAFVQAAVARDQREIAELATAVRMAFGAGKSEWKDYVDMLSGRTRKRISKRGKEPPLSRDEAARLASLFRGRKRRR